MHFKNDHAEALKKKKSKSIRKNLSTIVLILVFLVGIFLLLYPSVSDYWNSFHQSQTIANYAETVAEMDNETYEHLWQDAFEYNKKLLTKSNRYYLNKSEREEYNSALNASGNGIMGYIEIPSIKCSLPIYHGVDEAVLQIAIGHIEGTSLPAGGTSTHSALSGHRGLPSAKLFTNLDQLEIGDIFMLRILDETLTYEVDQILIVVPTDMSGLDIIEGEDLCTLISCTPFGVNTHRLLVRGHRIENQENADSIRVIADAMQIAPVLIAPFVAMPILFILLIILMIKYR